MGEYKEKQFGIIRYPNNEEETKVPVMPLVIILNDGTIGEAKSIRGLMTLIVGNEYIDAEDAMDDWHLRIRTARSESMKALSRGINAVVYDKRNKKDNGIINNNYASTNNDPDYDNEESSGYIYKIRVEGEKLFILSLIQIGAIKVLERQDSHLLISDECTHQCVDCSYKKMMQEGKNICTVYSSIIKEGDGTDCESYSNKNIKEYKGGTYINIVQEYNVEQLINKYEKYVR